MLHVPMISTLSSSSRLSYSSDFTLSAFIFCRFTEIVNVCFKIASALSVFGEEDRKQLQCSDTEEALYEQSQ